LRLALFDLVRLIVFNNIMPSEALKKESNLRNGQRATNDGHPGGFTLLELIVVISLIGIMLVLAVPRFHETLFLDENKTASRWIIGKIQALKEAAVRNQKRYTLHIDLDSARFWETDESMPPEAIENAALNAASLPDGLKIIDIEYLIRGKINSGQADIAFYKIGYSDKVLIHVQDGQAQVSYLIEPFLSDVSRYETYIGFDN
jgi:prepilin-type N-terminal cleavage/methylation domain-containing protein